jgi:hypothetical protein
MSEKKCDETGNACEYNCTSDDCYLIAVTLILAEQSKIDQIYDPYNIPDEVTSIKKKRKK